MVLSDLTFGMEEEMGALGQFAFGLGLFSILVMIILLILFFVVLVKEVSFWRNLSNNMDGISVTSLLIREGTTSLLVLFMLYHAFFIQIIIVAILGFYEYWKFTKILEFKQLVINDGNDGGDNVIPERSIFGIGVKRSYERSLVGEYDRRAWAAAKKYLIPAVVGYCLLNLVFERPTDLVSWIITSLTGFINIFGFLYFIPQAYVNYELKSVAHLPWSYLKYSVLFNLLVNFYIFVVSWKLNLMYLIKSTLEISVYMYQRSMFSRVVVKVEIEDDDD